MIQWADQGIVLGLRAFGEKDALIHVLTHSKGCHAGILRGIKSKVNQSIQVGTLVACQWKARLPEHLGTWTMEAEVFYLARILHDPKRLLALTSAGHLTCQLLPERHPYPNLFKYWKEFLIKLSEDSSWEMFYVLFETHLLHEMGFGLKLTSCAVTNSQENLKYVSPKTGRAVSENIGTPYHEKLLCLPRFLIEEKASADRKEILEGLEMTGHFLKKLFVGPKYVQLFQMRQRFIESL